jgi:hypothetical protein
MTAADVLVQGLIDWGVEVGKIQPPRPECLAAN